MHTPSPMSPNRYNYISCTNGQTTYRVCDSDVQTHLVVTSGLDALIGDTELSMFVLFSLCGRPILATFGSRSLDTPSGHDDDAALLFPNHLPEVGERSRQWTLC